MSSKQETAIHEAGLVVIGRVLGLAYGAASIVPDHDSAGGSITCDPYATRTDWEASGKWRELKSVFIGRILTLMSGREAAEELCVSYAEDGSDTEDRRRIGLMIGELSLSDSANERWEKRLRTKSRGLVRRHATTIKAVAAALVRSGNLTPAIVDKMVPRPRAAAIAAVRASRIPFWARSDH